MPGRVAKPSNLNKFLLSFRITGSLPKDIEQAVVVAVAVEVERNNH
jgi:hypothetical protein